MQTDGRQQSASAVEVAVFPPAVCLALVGRQTQLLNGAINKRFSFFLFPFFFSLLCTSAPSAPPHPPPRPSHNAVWLLLPLQVTTSLGPIRRCFNFLPVLLLLFTRGFVCAWALLWKRRCSQDSRTPDDGTPLRCHCFPKLQCTHNNQTVFSCCSLIVCVKTKLVWKIGPHGSKDTHSARPTSGRNFPPRVYNAMNFIFFVAFSVPELIIC